MEQRSGLLRHQNHRGDPLPPTAVEGRFRELAAGLADAARGFHLRGWALGTSGNFSAVVCREPLRLAITPSGVDKGTLRPGDVVEVGGDGTPLRGPSTPSAETLVHLAIVRAREAGAVFHTHSVWATLVSDAHAAAGGLAISGYEMLKGLEGVRSHLHREWLPILDNSQDYAGLCRQVEAALARHPTCHALLLRRHGLYTWGLDLASARRHVEILEFLLEVLGRGMSGTAE